MAHIPLGDFDRVSVQAPVQTGSPDLSGALAGSRAKAQLGEQAVGMAEHGMQIYQQRQEQQRQEDEALARAKAANGLAQHELEVRAAAADVSEQIQTGALNYNKAPEAYDAAVQKIKPVEIPNLPPALAEHYQGGLKNNALGGRLLIDGAVKQAKRDDFKSQFTTNLDTLGKIAGMPGADIAKVNAQAKAFIPLGRAAGLDEATLTKAVEDFADRNWTNQATQRFNGAHDDPVQLQLLQHDLTDEKGSYADKLDADKRNALAAQVGNRIDTLQAKAEHAADRADAIADRTLAQMDEQLSTGIPATPDQWAHWSDLFKDSPRKAEFTQRVQDERDIQTFLRKPIDQQLTEIQTRETALATNGGDLHAIANTKRLRAAVDANVKLLTEQPLVFAQARAGLDVKPLDLQSLADPSRAGKFGVVLQQRAATVAALQKQYGNQVKTNLLLPQEAQALSAVLGKMPPEVKIGTFAQLHQLAGSDASYSALMQQIAPDSPVMARAGELAAVQRKFSPDVTSASPNVALTMLKGEQLLNKSKTDKATDGKPSAFPMPADEKLRAAFADNVGNAFAGRPDLYERRLQEARAYYAGRTAETGAIGTELDDKLVREAVTATMGRMVDFNDRTVPAPWGMTESDFKDAADDAMQLAVRDLPADAQRNVLDGASLMQVGDGLYVMTAGRSVIVDANGRPRVVRVHR